MCTRSYTCHYEVVHIVTFVLHLSPCSINAKSISRQLEDYGFDSHQGLRRFSKTKDDTQRIQNYNTCFFLLCFYLGDGSTLIPFLVFKCLFQVFSCFVGMPDFENKIWFYRIGFFGCCRMAITHGGYGVCTLECAFYLMFERVIAFPNSHM